MGRIKYLCRGLQHQLINLLPYKWRRPFILYFSILGLIAYYNFAVYFSLVVTGRENTILTGAGEMLSNLISVLVQSDNKLMIIILIILLVIYITYKYCVKVEEDDQSKTEKNKEYDFNKSWYYQINGIISLGYALVTIITVVHIFWR